ncbi:hypothetical protein [Streptomyces sp. URMC 129]|uniref:hypothetical protein n=1 Tax=Streptomyces sp. URMC 129 TaxID=3423407 RepID=UPI003F1E36BA
MTRRHAVVSCAAIGASLLPLLLLGAAPAVAEGVPVDPIDVAELPLCSDVGDAAALAVELTGVPESVTATEWGEFGYRVTNTGDEPVSPVYAYASMWAYAADGAADPFPFAFEWFVNGAWEEVPFESDEADGHFGMVAELPPGASAEVRLRGRTLENRAGHAELTARARYDDATGEDGTVVCHRAEATAEFTIEAAPLGEQPGEPGEPGEAGQPGEAGEPAPAPGPELAETGPSSGLPVVALAGAALLAAGGGAAVLAHRRAAGRSAGT